MPASIVNIANHTHGAAARAPRIKKSAVIEALTPAEAPTLPSELPALFEDFRVAVLDRFAPQTPEDIATVLEYVDLTWRLRRTALLEAELITIEIQRMHEDQELKPMLAKLGLPSLEALALERLFERGRALVNLHRLEERLSRRLRAIQPLLDFLGARANEREYQRRSAEKAQQQQQQQQQPSPDAAQPAAVPNPRQQPQPRLLVVPKNGGNGNGSGTAGSAPPQRLAG